MANKKEQEKQNFVVTDRRRFSEEGEAQTPAAPPEEETTKPAPPAAPAATAPASPSPEAPEPAARPLTAEERAESARAYQESTVAFDDQLRKELGGKAFDEEFKVGIDRVLEPFYVTAMMQLGMLGQEGAERRVDIIGARQTIDTVNFLYDKTKGNLTAAENELFENIIYQLRMSYLEITNALAKAVQNPPGGAPKTPKA
jgi:hypothetical protein